MNVLNTIERARVLACLVEGNSVRSTVRLTGTAKKTVMRLLAGAGTGCAKLHDTLVRNVTAQHVQCDEIWSFCYSKQRNVPAGHKGKFGYGDVWTWVAIDADTKLAISYLD